jgi:CRP/FNR family transcriptional regulator
MRMQSDGKSIAGPAIHAIHPWVPGNHEGSVRHQLLSDDERAQLAKIATIVRFNKGKLIYREGDIADAAFNIISGVVTAFRIVNEAKHVLSFLHRGDLFGLSEKGRYSNSTEAATEVVAYKLPLPAVRRILDKNADLDVNVIIKLCEELRETQRHAVVLAQRRAATRLAMFLDLQEHLQAAREESISEIHLPMDRSSIAAYLGLTLAAVSRAFRTLVSKKIISCRNLHYVMILNRDAFNKLADLRASDA